jgi:minor extracellular serine protease Vpr
LVPEGTVKSRSAVGRALGGAALAAALALAGQPAGQAAEPLPVGPAVLHVVVLDGPGTAGYRGPLPEAEVRRRLTARQDQVLARAGVGGTTYRWTTALNGFAAELSAQQATRLARMPGVAAVETNAVRRLAGTAVTGTATADRPRGVGGAGTVVGVVDSGIDLSGPVFADADDLGPVPRDFTGACPDADGWTAACNDKVLSARHFVAGFSEDRLASGAVLSPYDGHGHGTQVASLAAGNAGISAVAGRDDLGTFSGAAPDARIAVYKACWIAPDPVDDGCATADLVAAIDRATADGVDVLTLAVTGSPTLDAVDRALLGAAESDVVVAAAAGNGATTGHSQTWVTTVGTSTGPARRGELALEDGSVVRGTMGTTRTVRRARLVSGAAIPAPGRTRGDAALCLPGSLDAGRAADRIVVCERGRVARVDKSAAVRLADGLGMVLLSTPGPPPSADLHSVPTLHVTADRAGPLRLAGRQELTGTLRPVSTPPRRSRLAGWSPRGRAGATVVKPDLVAPGTSLLAATSRAADRGRWELLSGTSASTALVAGTAARLRGAHPDWPAQWVRSALTTSAADVAGAPSSLRQGAGRVDVRAALLAGLVYDVDPGAWRRILEGRLPAARMNLPSVLVPRTSKPVEVTRRITHVGRTHLYYSSTASGFERTDVRVRPAAVRMAPGETRTVRIRVESRDGAAPDRAAPDSGWVTWRGADGTRTRIPVVVR